MIYSEDFEYICMHVYIHTLTIPYMPISPVEVRGWSVLLRQISFIVLTLLSNHINASVPNISYFAFSLQSFYKIKRQNAIKSSTTGSITV